MRLFLGIQFLILFGSAFSTAHGEPPSAPQQESPSDLCNRIVSLSPSITETLFSIQLGDQLVGVTKYCAYPIEAQRITRIGGFLDPNLESIVTLKPTLVVMLPEQRSLSEQIGKLGIKTLEVDHSRVDNILDGIRKIGALCGKERAAESLIEALHLRVSALEHKVQDLPKVRTMMVIGHGGTGNESVYVAGKDGFLDDLLNRAGGVNVNQATTISFPIMSTEGVLHVDPEVIVEVVISDGFTEASADRIMKDWKKVPEVSAVKNNRIYFFSQREMSIPGPRFPDILARLVEILHPEAASEHH